MAHETLKKFGYPETTIKEYPNWTLLLRPKQVTLGSLVLVKSSNEERFGDLSESAFKELRIVIHEIEHNLTKIFKYEKINYLMLMMVDPHVHYHVIPRYSKTIHFNGESFVDSDWPKPPDLSKAPDYEDDTLKVLQKKLKSEWES